MNSMSIFAGSFDSMAVHAICLIIGLIIGLFCGWQAHRCKTWLHRTLAK